MWGLQAYLIEAPIKVTAGYRTQDHIFKITGLTPLSTKSPSRLVKAVQPN